MKNRYMTIDMIESTRSKFILGKSYLYFFIIFSMFETCVLAFMESSNPRQTRYHVDTQQIPNTISSIQATQIDRYIVRKLSSRYKISIAIQIHKSYRIPSLVYKQTRQRDIQLGSYLVDTKYHHQIERHIVIQQIQNIITRQKDIQLYGYTEATQYHPQYTSHLDRKIYSEIVVLQIQNINPRQKDKQLYRQTEATQYHLQYISQLDRRYIVRKQIQNIITRQEDKQFYRQTEATQYHLQYISQFDRKTYNYIDNQKIPHLDMQYSSHLIAIPF